MAFLQIDYKSEALMRGVNIKVILPSDGMAGKWEPPYKTLYLLPGYSATATELITYLGLRGQSELKRNRDRPAGWRKSVLSGSAGSYDIL